LIGFAIALVLLPAKSKPTARGFVVTSSTISDPESPLFKNLLPLFAITIDLEHGGLIEGWDRATGAFALVDARFSICFVNCKRKKHSQGN
jgi:hypothetical protein